MPDGTAVVDTRGIESCSKLSGSSGKPWDCPERKAWLHRTKTEDVMRQWKDLWEASEAVVEGLSTFPMTSHWSSHLRSHPLPSGRLHSGSIQLKRSMITKYCTGHGMWKSEQARSSVEVGCRDVVASSTITLLNDLEICGHCLQQTIDESLKQPEEAASGFGSRGRSHAGLKEHQHACVCNTFLSGKSFRTAVKLCNLKPSPKSLFYSHNCYAKIWWWDDLM